jgi:hypothetical protein
MTARDGIDRDEPTRRALMDQIASLVWFRVAMLRMGIRFCRNSHCREANCGRRVSVLTIVVALESIQYITTYMIRSSFY